MLILHLWDFLAISLAIAQSGRRCSLRWAVKPPPFTWLFETFAVAVLPSVANTQEACVR